MEQIIREVDSLYDTWIGRWKAVRKFLTVLRHICYEIRDLKSQINDLHDFQDTVLNKQSLKLESLQEQINNLPSYKETEQKAFKTSGQIMDTFYKAIAEE